MKKYPLKINRLQCKIGNRCPRGCKKGYIHYYVGRKTSFKNQAKYFLNGVSQLCQRRNLLGIYSPQWLPDSLHILTFVISKTDANTPRLFGNPLFPSLLLSTFLAQISAYTYYCKSQYRSFTLPSLQTERHSSSVSYFKDPFSGEFWLTFLPL